MLAALLESPHTPEVWYRWSRDHRDSHDRIRQAVATQQQKNLTDYPIDPITGPSLGDFLQNNQQLHVDMAAILNLQSVDLLDVDFNDANQRDAWISIHYENHYQAEQVLKL